MVLKRVTISRTSSNRHPLPRAIRMRRGSFSSLLIWSESNSVDPTNPPHYSSIFLSSSTHDVTHTAHTVHTTQRHTRYTRHTNTQGKTGAKTVDKKTKTETTPKLFTLCCQQTPVAQLTLVVHRVDHGQEASQFVFLHFVCQLLSAAAGRLQHVIHPRDHGRHLRKGAHLQGLSAKGIGRQNNGSESSSPPTFDAWTPLIPLQHGKRERERRSWAQTRGILACFEL